MIDCLQVLSTHWVLPPYDFLCYITTFLPLLFSFTSTFSLCMIAVDRHHLLVTSVPNVPDPSPRWKVVASLIGVWTAGVIAASPILFNTTLEVFLIILWIS